LKLLRRFLNFSLSVNVVADIAAMSGGIGVFLRDQCAGLIEKETHARRKGGNRNDFCADRQVAHNRVTRPAVDGDFVFRWPAKVTMALLFK